MIFRHFFFNFAAMNKIYLLLSAFVLLLFSCQESIEDRVAREAYEYTHKNCPVKVGEGIVNDSMTFDRVKRIISYHYSLSGQLDTTFTDEQIQHVATELLNGVRNAAHLKIYKDAGLSFRYVYNSSKDPKRIVFDRTYTEKDYNQ